MTARVFYSWQSDCDADVCNDFIGAALGAAVSALGDATDILPMLDRDTIGVPGAPDIARTILAKIGSCQAFVADVTIVGRIGGRRPTPNPNVLIELGYAIGAIGDSRIALVQNTAFGSPEELPFDLRHKRVLTYAASPGADSLDGERQRLSALLQGALSTVLSQEENASLPVVEWQRLLAKAKQSQQRVLFETGLEEEVRPRGMGVTVFAVAIDGIVAVHSCESRAFALSFPLAHRGGLTLARIPFTYVEDIWEGIEGWLHVRLTKTIRFKQGTSVFV